MGIQEIEQQQPLNVKEMNNMLDGHKKYKSPRHLMPAQDGNQEQSAIHVEEVWI